MAQTTEAACLLQTGSMYPARVGLRGGSGEDVFFGIKTGGFSLYLGDEPIYHFDHEGRWQRAFLEGIHYLKGLDAVVRAIGREREGPGLVLRRRVLGTGEVVEIDERVRRAALELIEGLHANRLEAISPPPAVRTIGLGELTGYLTRVAAWDLDAWRTHRDRYEAAYAPWPFLPPDCPSPVVLQATLGHAFGPGRTPESPARSSREFREHAFAVATLLGRRTSQCRDIFLAGPDVLRQPVGLVLDYLKTIGLCFSDMLDPLRIGASGSLEADNSRVSVVHALLDDFRPHLPDLEGWRSLKAARLGRVTLGIESGDPAIRQLHGKSWSDEDLRTTVDHLKGAGIGVGLVVLVGAGGRALAADGLEATAPLLGSLGLAEGDLISLVDSRSLGLAPVASESLSDEETAGHQAALKKRLMAGRPSKGPRVVVYNPDKQWA